MATVFGLLNWNPIEQGSVDGASKDVRELSSAQTSQIGLKGWSQKAKDKGERLGLRLVSTPNKPGRKHHPKDSINGYQERSNPLFALSSLSRCQPDATGRRDALRSQCLWESQRICRRGAGYRQAIALSNGI